MDHRDCFGSLREISLDNGQTTTQSRPECRNCEEIRDCLRYSKELDDEKKERDELRKQNLITQIIDHSYVFSNELGSCLLTFLSRIYSSSLGAILFKNLFLFFEIPRNTLSSNLSISISRKIMDLLRGEKNESPPPSRLQATYPQRGLEEGFTLRIVLFQRTFPNPPEANMGMIAYEVARALASDELGIKLGSLLMPLRVALTGTRVSPPLFESMKILGENTVLYRLNNAIDLLEKEG